MSTYIGRFAPSPTGPLHAGSLVAAMASYLDALVHGGHWLLRIDDADLSRVRPSAAHTIAQQLRHYGLQWQGEITHTQDYHSQHQAALRTLLSQGCLYGCACTRQDTAHMALNRASGERVYSGACQTLALSPQHPSCRAVRLRVGNAHTSFVDRWAGEQHTPLATSAGDFIVWRPEHVARQGGLQAGQAIGQAVAQQQALRDNPFHGGACSYQLTMPCDDAAQGVTHVVRGADLLSSTAKQVFVYASLGLTQPSYLHVPVVLMESGRKLSKQNHAPPLPSTDPVPELERALAHLGCAASAQGSVTSFWRSAAAAWAQRLRRLPLL